MHIKFASRKPPPPTSGENRGKKEKGHLHQLPFKASTFISSALEIIC